MSEQHLIKDDSQRPNICFIGVDLAFENFRGHVDGGAEHGFSHFVRRSEVFAEAEISEFDDAVVEENIVGLKVPMHDIVLVEDLEGFQ